jgi:F-type H+-transporting ATPase subunit epsilon
LFLVSRDVGLLANKSTHAEPQLECKKRKTETRNLPMPETLQLEIVTPERLVVRDTAVELQIPGKDGYLGILPGHAPLITELGVGHISYKPAVGSAHHLAVAWGFAEVLPDKVTILAETAERAQDINVQRAQQARDRAQQRLAATGSSAEELQQAQDALIRAENRLSTAQLAGRSDVANLVS